MCVDQPLHCAFYGFRVQLMGQMAFLIKILFSFGCLSCVLANQLPYHARLGGDFDLELSWGVSNDFIMFELSGEVTKYRPFFGMSDWGKMNEADIVLFAATRDGMKLSDGWTNAIGYVKVDQSQDYVLLNSKEENGHFKVKFSRKINTCDRFDYLIDRGTTHVIFGFLDPFLFGLTKNIPLAAVKSGFERLQLIKSELNAQPSPAEQVKTFEIRTRNISMPEADTTYWCNRQRLPKMTSKHHIVGFEAVITPASEGIIHHMEVFHCEVPRNTLVPEYNAPCNSEEKPEGLRACRRVIGAWAMGAVPFFLPPEAGTAIGDPEISEYVVLEIHFNNPQLKKGVIDSSGMRFYYTSKVRPHDAGIMELGLVYTPVMAIPPQQPGFYLGGFCTSHCTRTALPDSGIYIFASQLHTHATGKRVVTKHVRGGTELPELNRDDHYSPHFQEIRLLPRQVHVLPGDGLTTYCEYHTEDRETVTLGGLSITDEMCLNYVHYYPRIDLELCKSQIADDVLEKYFEFLKTYYGDKVDPLEDAAKNYHSVDWTEEKAGLLQAMYFTSPVSMHCNTSAGTSFPGKWDSDPPVNIEVPLPLEDDPCLLPEED